MDFPACAGMSQRDRHFVDDCSFGAKAYGTLGTPMEKGTQPPDELPILCRISRYQFALLQDISRSFVENHNFLL